MLRRWMLLLTLGLSLASASASAALQWSRVDATCGESNATFEVPCGSLGTYYLGGPPPTTCLPDVTGAEEVPVYPRELLAPSGVDVTPAPFGTGSTQVVPESVVVIDFNDEHGWSVTKLISRVVDGAGDVKLAALDDPALQPLGSIGDAHLLAQLCDIVDGVDRGEAPPVVVNMSFGRLDQRDADERCRDASLACEVESAIDHLRTSGTTFVAASGNHRESLFPSNLPGVIAAGMLDMTQLVLNGTLLPSWESALPATGWMPGNAICLDNWPAPRGGSYSAAILSGWMFHALEPDQSESFDPLQGYWVPGFDAEKGCITLFQDAVSRTSCKASIDDLFLDFIVPQQNDCWWQGALPHERVEADREELDLPSQPGWIAALSGTNPTPAADPCIPCVDDGRRSLSGGGPLPPTTPTAMLEIDMSGSTGLPSGVLLDALYVQRGSRLFRVPLSTQQKTSIEAGSLARLDIDVSGLQISVIESLSLWFQVKQSASATCPRDCFWTTSPIFRVP